MKKLFLLFLLLFVIFCASPVYGEKITSLDELTAPANGDKGVIVDVSDTTQAATGSTKYMQLSNWLKAVDALIGTVNGNTISTGTGTLSLSTYTLTMAANSTLNQDLETTDSPTFAGLTLSGLVTDGPTVVTSGVFSSVAQLTAADGGTGLDGSGATNGQLLIGNGSGFSLAAISDGTGIDIANGSGTITPSFDATELGTLTWYNGTADTDIVWAFDGETNDGTWGYYEDEDAFATTGAAKYHIPETGNGGYTTQIFAATSGTLTGATDTIPLNIPSGWYIKMCQLHVKTAVVDDGGDDTWSAELNDGGTEEAIVTGVSAAQNTNINHRADADGAWTLTDATTDVLLTPNGGSFTAGEIEAHCLCEGFIGWTSE